MEQESLKSNFRVIKVKMVAVELLQAGIDELGLKLSNKQIQQLFQYVKLLLKWNRVYSLTAIRTIDKIITHHILDGLSLIKYLGDAANIVDVGSGMGVPAIILAISCPKIRVTAIDCSAKKTAFLRQVVIELRLKNCHIVTSLVEKYVPAIKFDLAVSRAFASAKLFLNLTRHLLNEHASWILMKSHGVLDEVDEIKEYKYEIIPTCVPFIAETRCLLKISAI